jgi:uncharacterized protein involved in type VI secretion and phage assembly
MSSARLANAVRQQARMSTNDFALPRLATISSYDASNHAVKVQLQPEDPEIGPQDSNWMPLGAIGIGNGWGVAVGPQIGDQVLVVYENGDFSSGTIVARVFSVAQPAIAVPSGEIWMVHESTSLLKFHNDGTVAITAASTMTYTAAEHHFIGPVQMDNTLNVTETVSGQGGMTISGDNGSGHASTVTGNTNFVGGVTANGHDIGSTHQHINSGGSGLGGVPQ